MWPRIRRFGVELYAFFTTPYVIKNCMGMGGMLLTLFLLTFWWLKCYTKHGDSVQVPSYVGMSFREAARKARARDFGVAVSDSLYVPGKPPGEIIAQDPKPESRVKEGRTLYFTVTKNNPDIIKLPNLGDGDDYDLYSRKLSRLGLKPRIVARMPNPKLGSNVVIDVIYHGDTITRQIRSGLPVPVEMGSTIDFVVSEEVTMTVTIPECVGQTLDAARFLIQTNELSVGSILSDGTTTKDDKDAYVYRQTPKYDPNGTMRKGEQIDLYITKEMPGNR
ncbi:MAG: PASTA domain-containing protein [Saprospiraceae bacterium]|nr:PASTA domain-containing protein [Saprospiraceae bacterium]